MKLSYSAWSPLAHIEFMVMGGGMGNSSLDEPLRTMAMPDEIHDAIEDARQQVAAQIRKAQKQGRVVSSINYEVTIEDGADAGGVLAEGAYVKVTAHVTYE